MKSITDETVIFDRKEMEQVVFDREERNSIIAGHPA